MPLTKVRRGGTDTGISDSSDATAITIDSNENVGIGVSPTTSYGVVTQIHDTGTAGANLRLTDANSGSGTGNGFEIIQLGANNYLINRENGFISIYNNGSERVKVHSGGVVSFNNGIELGSGLDATSANTLDDYEEGTWTPAIVGASNTPTYYNQVGRYTKIGRSVTIQCFLQTNVSPTYSNANTQFKISGVPFNLLAIGYTGGQGTVNSQSFRFTSGDNDQGSTGSHLTVGINADEQLIFHNTGSGQTRGSVENSGTTSGFIIEATLTYFTDA